MSTTNRKLGGVLVRYRGPGSFVGARLLRGAMDLRWRAGRVGPRLPSQKCRGNGRRRLQSSNSICRMAHDEKRKRTEWNVMSDCCAVPGSTDACAIVVDKEIADADSRCSTCGIEGRPVERQTILHHVKHEHLDRLNGEAYRFCAEPNCPIVYYGDKGACFTVDDLREPVAAKIQGDARPICYCFGFILLRI